jgi:ABC-2 type transport system ATP-binding protein
MTDAIVLTGVSKHFGPTMALNDLSLRFPAAMLTGFLGPNGAGKTTTFRAVLGLTRPQKGSIEVLGMKVGPDTRHIVKRVGAVVEEPGLHKTLTARDNLKVAALTLGAGHNQADELLDFVGLTEAAGRKVDGFSKGMRQRLALAIALLGDPDVLLLDEPLDGLDPAGQVTFKQRLRRLVDERGKTVIVSSHDLNDVEQLADHVIVINRGRRMAAGALHDVLGDTGGYRVEIAETDRAVEVLTSSGFSAVPTTTGIEVEGTDGAAIARTLGEAGLYPSALIPQRASLERVFLDLTEGGP